MWHHLLDEFMRFLIGGFVVDEKAAKDLEAAAAGWQRRMDPQFPLDEER